MSEAEYLAMEARSDQRHIYVDGRVYGMSGASKVHNRIALNLATRFLSHLGDGGCHVYMADVKCRIEVTRTYLYPDVMVVCDEPEDADSHFVESPVLVVEVLSKSNEVLDWLEKLESYRTLKSLKEYVLLRQDSYSAYVFERQPGEVGDTRDHQWIMKIFGGGDDVTLNALDLAMPIEDIYAGVSINRPSPMENSPSHETPQPQTPPT